MYFTIYYFQDLNNILKNVHYWLRDRGIFCVHVVNKDKFDPILDLSSPFPGFSVQKYSKKRVTKSTVHFNNFVYSADFRLYNDNTADFLEKFEFKKNNKKRKQAHKFFMFRIDDFINICRNNGFKLVNKTDLLSAGYEYQYIFFLQKI
tara:strand:- start:41 stop:484 length:444 start_codon:yes stop_codon:yes gene_type:complete